MRRSSTYMPRYFFDLVDGKTIEDHGGQNLSDDALARQAAIMLAARLASEKPHLKNRDFAILVMTQSGRELCRVPLDTIH